MIVFASKLESQDSERSGNLPEVTQLLSGGTRLPASPVHTLPTTSHCLKDSDHVYRPLRLS